MKKYLFLALFMLVALLVKAQDENGEIVKVGDQMPSFTIVNDNGTKKGFLIWGDKKVNEMVLNLYAIIGIIII